MKLRVFHLFLITFLAILSPVFAQNLSGNFSSLPAVTNAKIDSMVQNCIGRKVIPGCQILAIHRGEVVYHKNFGYQYYDTLFPVNDETMYDVASMTKSLATTLAVMKLYDDHLLRLTDKVGDYLEFSKGTPVADLTLAELMTHTSGLAPFIPFYREISPQGVWDTAAMSRVPDDIFRVQAADSVFLHKDFPLEVLKKIVNYPLRTKKYVYSDLGFVLMKEIVEKVTGQTMDGFLMTNFYEPLGLQRTGFNPLGWTSADNIAPTENDKYFRKQVLRGYVHDQTAAVFGGVCGNAGLFSTAHEVSVILQMLMAGGTWNGHQYLTAKTVNQFVTMCPMHGCQRRGLGFDTPSFTQPNAVLPAMSGNRTFGHQGFTGTVFWCDPQNDFVYIFLSNRVYPNADDNLLSKSKLRLLVHEEILKAVLK